MSEAVEVTIADALVTQLAGGSLSQSFTPVASWADWKAPLESDDSLKEGTLYVDVVPVATGLAIEAVTRERLGYDVPIDVAVRKKFAANDHDVATGRIEVAKVDEMMLLVQEIHELFSLANMTDFDSASWQETKRIVAPLKPHLRDFHQFTGIVRLTFRRASGGVLMFGARCRVSDHSKRVREAAKKAAFRNLGHAAASISKDAKASLDKAEGPSQPGQPPHTHKGAYLRRAIRWDADATSAVIGPMASVVGQAGAIHEFGEERGGVDFPERPFMLPALERALPRFAGEWSGSIGE